MFYAVIKVWGNKKVIGFGHNYCKKHVRAKIRCAQYKLIIVFKVEMKDALRIDIHSICLVKVPGHSNSKKHSSFSYKMNF